MYEMQQQEWQQQPVGKRSKNEYIAQLEELLLDRQDDVAALNQSLGNHGRIIGNLRKSLPPRIDIWQRSYASAWDRARICGIDLQEERAETARLRTKLLDMTTNLTAMSTASTTALTATDTRVQASEARVTRRETLIAGLRKDIDKLTAALAKNPNNGGSSVNPHEVDLATCRQGSKEKDEAIQRLALRLDTLQGEVGALQQELDTARQNTAAVAAVAVPDTQEEVLLLRAELAASQLQVEQLRAAIDIELAEAESAVKKKLARLTVARAGLHGAAAHCGNHLLLRSQEVCSNPAEISGHSSQNLERNFIKY